MKWRMAKPINSMGVGALHTVQITCGICQGQEKKQVGTLKSELNTQQKQ